MIFITLLILAAINLAAAMPASSPAASKREAAADDLVAPDAVTYAARFSGDKINGYIGFEPAANGAVNVKVGIEIADSSIGPFPYHIHTDRLPAGSSDCALTKGHFDPDHRNGSSCTSQDLTQCERGDISAKFGKLPQFNGKARSVATYLDPTISLSQKSNVFIGNRSIVIHDNTGARYGCANINWQRTGHWNLPGRDEASAQADEATTA